MHWLVSEGFDTNGQEKFKAFEVPDEIEEYPAKLLDTIKAEPIKKCPKCGGKVTRLLGAGSGIIFKGTGFYQTDYKNKGSSGKPCDKPKSDGCKGCSMHKDK